MSGFGDLLQQIIGGARAAQRDPRLPSMPVPLVGLDLAAPFNALPAPLRQVASTMPMGALLTNPIADMVASAGRAGLNATSRATTGQMLANLGRVLENPVAHAALGTPTGRAVVSTLPVAGGLARALMIPKLMEAAEQARANQVTTAGGNPWQRALAANEAGARGNAYTVGLVNAVYDPTNALPLGAELAKAAQLTRLAKVLEGVNTTMGIANVPLIPAGETTSAAVRRLRNRVNMLQTGREAARGLGPVFDVAQAEAGVRQMARNRQFVDEGGLGGPEQIGHLPTMPDEAFNTKPTGRYGNVPKREGPLGPPATAYYRSTPDNAADNLAGLTGTAKRLGLQQPAPQTVEDLRAAFAGLRTPPPAVPPVTAAVSAPTPPSTVADLGGNVSREAVIKATANRSTNALTPTLRSLHNAVYPGGQADFAIPALTGVGVRDFRTSLLTDHPTGNVAEQYLDYLVSRVQGDKRAAARLAQADPDLLADVMALPPHPTPVNEQKVALQQRLGAGKFRQNPPEVATNPPMPATNPPMPATNPPMPATGADPQAAFDAILASGDSGTMGGELPAGTAFWERRLGVGPDEARALLDGAVADGRLGVGPDGALRFKPKASLRAVAGATPESGSVPGAAPASALSNVDIAPEAAPRPSTVEPLPAPPAAQPSAGELLRRYRERWPEGTPVAPEVVPPPEPTPAAGPIALSKPVKQTITVEDARYRPKQITVPVYNNLIAIAPGRKSGSYRLIHLPSNAEIGAAASMKDAQGFAERFLNAGVDLNFTNVDDLAPADLQALRDVATEGDKAGRAALSAKEDARLARGHLDKYRQQLASKQAQLEYYKNIDTSGMSRDRQEHFAGYVKAYQEGVDEAQHMVNFYEQRAGVTPQPASPVTPTQARDELFADAADTGVADVAQADPAAGLVEGTPAYNAARSAYAKEQFDRATQAAQQAHARGQSGPAYDALLAEAKKWSSTYRNARVAEIGERAYRAEQEAGLGFGKGLFGGVQAAKDVQEGVVRRPTPGGDIAAGGGGGLGIANLPGGLSGAWRMGSTAIGAGLGGTLGAGAGFATADGDLKDRLDKAAQAGIAGAALGGAAGLGLSRNTTGEAADNILRHAWDQAGKGQAEAVAARKTSGLIPRLRDIYPALKRARIQHPKNAFQDEGFGSVVTAGLQPRAWENLAKNREDVSRRLATAKTDEDLLPTPTQDRRAAMGLAGTPVNLGASLAQGEKKAGRQLSDIQTGIIEGGASLLSPTGLATNAIGVGLGAAKGLKRGALSGLFHGVNDVTNGTFRSSIYDDELATLAEGAATDFLGALRAKGIDVSSLAPDGSFSAADAERVAGPAAGKAWAGWVQHANDLAQQRARFIMGDYGKVGPIEKMLGGPVPFASWVIRAYPVALALAAEHPIVALAMYQYYRATTKTKGDGSPDYTGGMIPIPTSTPYVGPLVAAMVPGNKGTVYVAPVGAISPVSNEMFSAGEDDPGATWYQKATKFLERTGLPGVNPAIQTGAYLTGLDYKGPGSQTNTQGIEDAAALIPGNAGLPNPMPQLLAAGRSALSPTLGPALGGQADPNASVYDPVTKRYAELWYEKTHLTLSDPRNRIGLVGMADPDNPLMQQARREVLLAGAARNVNSLVDPVGATAQTDTAQQVKAAQDKAALPSYSALAGLDPFIRAQVQQQIDATKAANPLLTLHQGETPSARANMLILDWERQNQGLRNLWPGMYQLQLLAERERLGLERPGSVASEYRTFDQRNAGTLPGGPMIMPGVPLPMDNRAGQAVRDLVRQRLSAGR